MPWTENPAEPACRAARQIQGRKRWQHFSSPAASSTPSPAWAPYVGHSRWAAGDPRLPVRRQGRQGARRARCGGGLGKGKTPVYLGPDSAPISIPGLPDLRIYVLGPPRDKKLLQLEEKADEMYRLAARGGWPLERALNAGLAADAAELGAAADDYSAPFDPSSEPILRRACWRRGQRHRPLRQGSLRRPGCFGAPAPAKKRGNKPPDENLTDQSWRRIDADWLAIAADLAMQLDRGVNNTSLVLAFEFIGSGRVVLFPAMRRSATG